jgi:predicted AAA+ superfamily ATPase
MKDVSDQQVAEHLKRLNPWWQSATMDEATLALLPRAYLDPVRQLLLEPNLRRAVVLLGPRRVGKTILIRHLVADLLARGTHPQRIAYVEMDHPLLHGQSLEALIRQIEEAAPGGEGTRYLFFDEIQSHKDWEKHLKPLVDHRPDLRILVSGSAAAALKRQSTESGAGRFTDFLLPPLTFSEYLHLRPEPPAIREETPGVYLLEDITRLNEQFAEYVNYGGYPELALSPVLRGNPERFVKSDIVDKVLLRDLPQLYGIKDIQELNSLFTLLAFNTAEEVALEPLSKRSGVGKQTIQKYIEYLEAAFLIKRVFRVDQDGKRYQRERNFKVSIATTQSLSAFVKGICDVMRRSNCASALQYVPELTWILFLRILDAQEQRDARAAEALGAQLQPALRSPYRWQDWAAPWSDKSGHPRTPEGKPFGWKRQELFAAGDGKLFDFINKELLPHLHAGCGSLHQGLPNPAASPKQRVIGRIMTAVERCAWIRRPTCATSSTRCTRSASTTSTTHTSSPCRRCTKTCC